MKLRVSLPKDCQGSGTVMTMILMFLFVGILALVIDLAHLQTVKTELSNAADDCALRGARGFLPDNISGLTNTLPNPGPGTNGAVDKAAAAISDNKSDDNQFHKVNLTDLNINEIDYGVWDYIGKFTASGKPDLLPWNWPPDSSLWGQYIGPGVRVPVKRDENHNLGQVRMTLANIFGIKSVSVSAKAAAALSGLMQFNDATPIMPFGPMADPPPPKTEFTGYFKNDKDDTVGWSNLQGVKPGEKPPNTSAKDLKDLIDGKGSPDTMDGKTVVSINNGQIASAIQTMTGPNNRFGLVETASHSNVYQPDADHESIPYLLPVYDKTMGGTDPNADTGKFNQGGIAGSVPVKLVEVGTPPLNYIKVIILDGYIAPGGGGAPYFGALSAEPKLTQ
jgi:hypothetical protein